MIPTHIRRAPAEPTPQMADSNPGQLVLLRRLQQLWPQPRHHLCRPRPHLRCCSTRPAPAPAPTPVGSSPGCPLAQHCRHPPLLLRQRRRCGQWPTAWLGSLRRRRPFPLLCAKARQERCQWMGADLRRARLIPCRPGHGLLAMCYRWS